MGNRAEALQRYGSSVTFRAMTSTSTSPVRSMRRRAVRSPTSCSMRRGSAADPSSSTSVTSRSSTRRDCTRLVHARETAGNRLRLGTVNPAVRRVLEMTSLLGHLRGPTIRPNRAKRVTPRRRRPGPAVSTPPRRRTSRPGRRMFAMTLTIVVVLVLGGVLLAWRGYNSRRDDALEDFGNGAPAAADVAVRFFTERLTLLNSIAESEAVRSGDVGRSGPSWHPSPRRSSASTTSASSTRTGSCRSTRRSTSMTAATSGPSSRRANRSSARPSAGV